MRKVLLSALLAVSTLGLAACSDNVDEGATGSVEGADPAIEQPVAPADDPMAAPAEEPAAEPAQ